jgi:hypothetical protein
MAENDNGLVGEIEERAGRVATYVAVFDASSNVLGMSFHSQGTLYFRKPASMRSELELNGQKVVDISTPDVALRFFVDQKLAWRYDVKEVCLPDYFEAGLSEAASPFNAVDRETLRYEGLTETAGQASYKFSGKTRDDVRLHRTSLTWPLDVELFIDTTHCLLLRYHSFRHGSFIGQDLRYTFKAVNLPLDRALFTLESSGTGIRYADVTDMLKDAIDPAGRDIGPSMN